MYHFGRSPAAGTSGSERKPLVQALQVVSVQAGHHAEGVPQLEVLQTNRAFLPAVEGIVIVSPVHCRDSPDLLGRKSLLAQGLWEEGGLVGFLCAELVLHPLAIPAAIM